MRIKRTRRRKKIIKNKLNSETESHEEFQDLTYRYIKVEPECDIQEDELESFNAGHSIVSCSRVKSGHQETIVNDYSNVGQNNPSVVYDECGGELASGCEQTVTGFGSNEVENVSEVCQEPNYIVHNNDLTVMPVTTEYNSNCDSDSPFVFVPVPMQPYNVTEQVQFTNNWPQNNTGASSDSSKGDENEPSSLIAAEEDTPVTNSENAEIVFNNSKDKRPPGKRKYFFCSQCSYKSFRSNHLKVHERIHTGEKPFACDKCDYKSTQLGHLKIHERTHTGEKPFYCDQCNYRSSQLGHLKLHKTNHTGEKPFACDVCSYKCTQLSDLRVHKRTHSGEKPFSCNKCSYRCTTASYLKRHKKNHTGPKPFSGRKSRCKTKQANNIKLRSIFHTVYVQGYNVDST